MPGFTLKIDTSQFHKATVEAEKDAKDLCVTLKIVPQELQKAEKAQTDFAKATDQSAVKLKALASRVLALVSAYKAVQGIKNILSVGTEYNAQMEKAQLGIASVVASTMKIVDAEGKAVEGAKKFAAAQKLSIDMAKALDYESMKSPAEYNDLLTTFQTLLGPATSIGMTWQQTLDTTILMSNTLSAMNIPMDRLAAETKSILTNTRINQSQVAMTLGITKEDVTEWTKKGVLIDKIKERLEQMGYAGEAVEVTFEATKAYMDDVVKNLQGDMTKGFFEEVKKAMNTIAEAFYKIDEQKKRFFLAEDFRPLVETCNEISRIIGEELNNAANEFVEYLRSISQSPEKLAALENFFKGAFEAVHTVGRGVAGLANTIEELLRIIPDDVEYAAAGGIIGYKLFGPAGAIAGIMMSVLSMLGKILDEAARAAGLNVELAAITTDLENEGYTLDSAENIKEYREEYERRVAELKKGNKSIVSDYAVSQDVIGGLTNRNRTTAQEIADRTSANRGKAGTEHSFTLGGALNTPSGGSGKGSKGSLSGIETARRKIIDLRAEIDRLNGVAENNTLDKKLYEIATAGQKAGMTASQISDLKQAYIEAFQKDTLKSFNKELLQAQGNTAALRDIEIAEAVQKWTNSLKDAGFAADEAAEKANRLGEAMRSKQNYQDLQTVNSVLKELEEKTGQYGLSLESSNKLIEQQVQLWRQAGVPEEYIQQLREIKELEMSNKAFDKMKLQWTSFYAQSMDWGSQLGSAATGWADGFANSLASMAATGKANFTDLANSIVSDLSRMAMRMMIVWAIGKAMGMFAGGISNGTDAVAQSNGFSSANPMADFYGGMPVANGGVFNGGTLSRYSNRIVSKPTLFTYGSHVSRFARGAGLMGEAGPEAIMPLARHNGKLGVDASGMTAAPVNIIVNNNANAEVETNQRRNNDGSVDIEMTIVSMVNKDMSRRGGQLNRTMRNQYGAKSIVTSR